jgi:hypothetical protein
VIASTHVAADRHLSAWNFPLLLHVIGKSLVAGNLRENQLARHRSPRSNRSRRQLGSAPLTREVCQAGKQRLRGRRTGMIGSSHECERDIQREKKDDRGRRYETSWILRRGSEQVE